MKHELEPILSPSTDPIDSSQLDPALVKRQSLWLPENVTEVYLKDLGSGKKINTELITKIVFFSVFYSISIALIFNSKKRYHFLSRTYMNLAERKIYSKNSDTKLSNSSNKNNKQKSETDVIVKVSTFLVTLYENLILE